jgi:hypothetical protein
MILHGCSLVVTGEDDGGVAASQIGWNGRKFGGGSCGIALIPYCYDLAMIIGLQDTIDLESSGNSRDLGGGEGKGDPRKRAVCQLHIPHPTSRTHTQIKSSCVSFLASNVRAGSSILRGLRSST